MAPKQYVPDAYYEFAIWIIWVGKQLKYKIALKRKQLKIKCDANLMSFNEIKIFNWFFVADKLTIKIKKFYAYKTVNQDQEIISFKISKYFYSGLRTSCRKISMVY